MINSVYIISKSGSLIYNCDYNVPKIEKEVTYSYPLELVLIEQNEKTVVVFGQRDGVKVGHILLAVNGADVIDNKLPDGRSALQIINNSEEYPLNLKFGKPRITTNQKIVLGSMFYPLFAIAAQLSPEANSSGIEMIEADSFYLYCFQTPTGVKFIVITNAKHPNIDQLLKKMYELYADFALKNPFYSLEMPIRCELFENNLKIALDCAEKGVGVN